MKFKGTKLSKRTVALLAAAVVMLGSGGVLGTRAIPQITADAPYDAQIELNDVEVQLLENGEPVGTDEELTEEKLFTALEGKAEPGMPYDDVVSVANNGAAPEYVRVIVRKYWTNPKGEKDKKLTPELIELKTADGWVDEPGPSDETTIYYLTSPLAVEGKKDLFTGVRVNESVAEERTKTETKDGTRTTITYIYTYDGYKFNIEAEVQSVQTHSSEKALKSLWGIDPGEIGIKLVD